MRAALLLSVLIPAAAATAAVSVGAPAPGFTATDSNGRAVSLADYRGKTVVLEWNNPGCPYVQKHYNSGNMQRTQRQARAMGVTWLSVNSGAPGMQGHMTGAQANGFVRAQKATTTAYLLDPKGDLGHLYGATATPGMVVIDPQGRVVYQGAIDDKPTANPDDIKVARNHVLAALGEMKAGKSVSVARTKVYGCSVKYAA